MTTCRIDIDGKTLGEFNCSPQQTVLESAAAAGWQLPHSCMRGICESCRVMVHEGTLAPPVESDGTALICRARALSDIRIAPARAERLEPLAVRVVEARYFRMRMAAPDVAIVDLRFPAGVRVRHKAGQYLKVHLPGEEPRSFSLATSPRSSDAVQLHVRVQPGGRFAEGVLPTLKPGDPLRVELPFGDFYLRESPADVILVAGGTGFAPMQSILDDVLARQSQRRFFLYWGARRQSGLYALDTVQRWARRYPNFKFVGVLSEETGSASCRDGLVHRAVLDDFPSLAQLHAYVCGAPAMVAAAHSAFLEHGLPASAFFSDAFASPSTRPK